MRLAVIGGVAGGMTAALRARRLDRGAEIVVLEKSATVTHSLCGLPYYIEGQVTALEQLLAYTPERLRSEYNIDVRTGATVVSILHPRRQLVLAGGERIPYDRLVIANGARPDTSLPGADQAFTFNSPADAERLKCFLEAQKPRSATVVGAGYIGLEMAGALRRHGLAVTVFEQSPYVLGREDTALAETVRVHLARFGIDLRLGARVDAIDPQSGLVLLAGGLKPNIELAAEAGVEIGRSGAIRVNDRMETNLGGVFAAGDCAETTHLVTGRPVWIPLGSTANKMGRVAGANAVGRRERLPGVVGTSIVKLCGMGLGLTGLSEREARRQGFDAVSARVNGYDKPRYFFGTPTTVELVADRRSGRLIGGSVLGEDGVAGRIDTVAAAVTARMRVEDFAQLDMAYAPPFSPAWDPVLVAARQLLKLLD